MNNVFLGSSAGQGGNAIVVVDGHVDSQNDIIVNGKGGFEAVYIGGGLFTSRHSTIASNGSFALTTNGGTALLTNTNVSTHTVGGFYGNNIIADNSLLYDTISQCGGGAICTNNIVENPQFVAPASGDYHIDAGSAAIDSGVLAGIFKDIDHEPRFGIPDIGADEYWAPGTLRLVYVPAIQG